jgi:hypothetical protein
VGGEAELWCSMAVTRAAHTPCCQPVLQVCCCRDSDCRGTCTHEHGSQTASAAAAATAAAGKQPCAQAKPATAARPSSSSSAPGNHKFLSLISLTPTCQLPPGMHELCRREGYASAAVGSAEHAVLKKARGGRKGEVELGRHHAPTKPAPIKPPLIKPAPTKPAPTKPPPHCSTPQASTHQATSTHQLAADTGAAASSQPTGRPLVAGQQVVVAQQGGVKQGLRQYQQGGSTIGR